MIGRLDRYLQLWLRSEIASQNAAADGQDAVMHRLGDGTRT